jgi:hypothetical protein
MSAMVLRDRATLPALDALLMRTRDADIEQLKNRLAAGFSAKGAARVLRALIALALDFSTWQRLTQEGLTDKKAAELMASLVAGSVSPDRT